MVGSWWIKDRWLKIYLFSSFVIVLLKFYFLINFSEIFCHLYFFFWNIVNFSHKILIILFCFVFKSNKRIDIMIILYSWRISLINSKNIIIFPFIHDQFNYIRIWIQTVKYGFLHLIWVDRSLNLLEKLLKQIGLPPSALMLMPSSASFAKQ